MSTDLCSIVGHRLPGQSLWLQRHRPPSIGPWLKGQQDLRLSEIRREARLPTLGDLGTVCLRQSVGEESYLTLQAGRQCGGEPGHRWGIWAGGARQSTH